MNANEETSVTIDPTGDTAVLVGRSLVTATISDPRGTWKPPAHHELRPEERPVVAMHTIATTF